MLLFHIPSLQSILILILILGFIVIYWQVIIRCLLKPKKNESFNCFSWLFLLSLLVLLKHFIKPELADVISLIGVGIVLFIVFYKVPVWIDLKEGRQR